MSLTSRLGLGLALSLIAGLSAPMVVPAILDNVSPKSGFAGFLAQAQTAQAQTLSFSDVSTDYWAHDYIEGLAKSNIISGFGDGTFKPNDPVTRAQFAAILRQAFLQSPSTTAQAFKDVPTNYWATGAISSARSAGFLSGYPDNTFKPNDRILRVQALVSLANGLKYPTGNLPSLSSYKDADTVPAYARPSTAAAAQANLIVSYPAPDQISPNRAASRAEVAAFVYQALVKAGRVDPIAVKPERRWQITPITTIAGRADRMSLSGNGQRLTAIVDFGSEIQVWNTQTGSLLRTITAGSPDNAFRGVAISQDGTKIAFTEITEPTGAIELTVQAVEDGKVLITKSLNPPKNQLPETNYPILPYTADVGFSPDGKQLMTQIMLGVTDRIELVYHRLDFQDIATGKVTQSIDMDLDAAIPGAGTPYSKSAFSPDGSLLATLGVTGPAESSESTTTTTTINIWRRNNNNRFDRWASLPISKDWGRSIDVAFTRSNLLNLSTSKSSRIYLDTWNPQTGEQVQSTALSNEEFLQNGSATPSPDGTSYFASCQSNLGACFGNVQTGEIQRNLDRSLNEFGTGVFSGDGKAIAVADGLEIRIFTKAAP